MSSVVVLKRTDGARAEVGNLTRERTIMQSAISAIGSHGVRGASLRDIARDAGVSLTLIHHHFGSKSALVEAAIDSLMSVSADPLSRLRGEVQQPVVLPHVDVVHRWVTYLRETFGGESRAPYLVLMQRLRIDPTVDKSTRASLDAAESYIHEALQRAFPQAMQGAVDLALQWSRGALLAAFAGQPARHSGEDFGAAQAGHSGQDEMLVRYVAAGIAALLEPTA